MTPKRRRKCRNCGQLYEVDPRNRWHQHYCSQPACHLASKTASQQRWRASENGRDYFRGPANRLRVQAWRKAPLRHPAYVNGAAFSPDGRCLLTASGDGRCRVWEVRTGRPLSLPLPSLGRAATSSFDGRGHLVTVTPSAACIWDLQPDERPADDLASLAELLSGSRLDDTGAAVPLSPQEWRHRWEYLRARYPR